MFSMKISENAAEALKVLESCGFEAWCVGGCVRDSVMGITPHDWDVCTSARPEQILKAFSGFRTIPTGLKHGTITVLVNREPIEVTTYRTDGKYSDHRRPDSVSFVSDVRSDLERRDFTINAMCADLNGKLYDPSGGMKDIAGKLIRCVGDPEKRFEEDALRILRALRFAAKTGFDIEKNTLDAAIGMKKLLDGVSAERIFSELKSLAVQPFAGRVLMGKGREIIAQIIPEIAPCFDFPQNNPHHCYDVWTHIVKSVDNCRPDTVLRLTMLFHDIGKPGKFTCDENGISHFKMHQILSAELADGILRRLKSDNDARKRVCALVREHDNRIPPEKKSVKRFIAKHGYDFFEDYLEVRRADTLAQSEFRREEKLTQLKELEYIAVKLREEDSCIRLNQLAVNGGDMKELGLKGRQIGDTLKAMLGEVIEERLENERGVLIRFAEKELEKYERLSD